ncbi:MAG TPA: hypothetical protein VK464_22660 [Symbiobacteriaceae bacterium]|nr:hypothetical protein [Symbiobacteriaceae bacterium]
MMLSVPQRVGMVVLSMAAPRRLAEIMLRPYPQPMDEELQTSGYAERVEFDANGGIRCRGWWVTPVGGGLADRVVVLAHGWTSHALRLANYLEPLLGLGFQVMLYNARSHGDSDHYPVCSLAGPLGTVAGAIAGGAMADEAVENTQGAAQNKASQTQER